MTDADPFDAFVREYQDMVFATAVRLLGQPAEAEDVTQAVFLKAFERFEQIGSSATAAGWLKTVTTNLCLNHLSRYRRRWRLFSEMPGPAGKGDAQRETYAATIPAVASAAPDFALEQTSEHERLEDAVRQLPDHQRVPLVLFHFEQQSYRDIAAMLGVSLGKVKTDIHRGREALKAALTTRTSD